MVNDIISGISRAIGRAFPEYRVYTDSVKQGFQMDQPCFFVLNISASETPLKCNRAMRHYGFDVHYFPKESHTECHDVAESLYIILRRFELIDGTGMLIWEPHHEIQDGVLHFIFDVRPIIYYRVEKTAMQETLSHDINIKES